MEAEYDNRIEENPEDHPGTKFFQMSYTLGLDEIREAYVSNLYGNLLSESLDKVYSVLRLSKVDF